MEHQYRVYRLHSPLTSNSVFWPEGNVISALSFEEALETFLEVEEPVRDEDETFIVMNVSDGDRNNGGAILRAKRARPSITRIGNV
jgi:hypothetical protein